MYKRFFTKFILIVLCFVLVLGSTACSGSKPASSVQPTTTSQPVSLSKLLDPNAEPAKDPLGKFSPAIEVTTIHTSNDVVSNLPKGDTIESNVYTRTWLEKLGIKLTFKWTSPGTQSEEKMNLMIASGDLPDFFYVTPSQFEKLAAAGQLQDITKELVDYSSKYTKKYLTGDYAGLLDGVTKDGKVYGIPNGQSYTDSGWMLWTRNDWLEKAGLSIPKTVSELDTVLEAFKTKKLDASGQTEKFPIPLADADIFSTSWGIGDSFFNMFHSYPNIWVKNSKGELEDGMFGAEQRENTRKALVKLQEYYKKGYINPDFATLDSNKYNEMITNNKSGLVFGGLWDAWWPLNLNIEKNPNAKWLPVAIPSSDGKLAKASVNATTILGISVAKKGVKNPEALVKMSNLFHDLNNNPDTMKFGQFNTDPKTNAGIFLVYPMLIYNPSFNYEAYKSISNAFKTKTAEKMCEAYTTFYNQAKLYVDKNDKVGFPAYLSYTDKGSLGVVDDYINRKALEMNEYTAMPTTQMLENAPIIKKAYDQMFLKVVMGGDINLYDGFLKQFDNFYAANVNQGVNSWFKAKKSDSIQKWFDDKK